MNRLIASLFALVFASNTAFADGDKSMRLVHVSGTAEVKIPATIAEVYLGVVSDLSPSAQEVQKAVAEVSQRLVVYLRENGVEDMQTRSLRLSPRLEQVEGKDELETVYSAENMLIFRTDPEKLGQLLDQVVKLGATRIDRVHSFASDAARREAKKKAISEATARASAKAEAALLTLNAEIQEVVSVSIDHRHAPAQGVRPLMRAATNPQTTAFEAGMDNVHATVYLEIAY